MHLYIRRHKSNASYLAHSKLIDEVYYDAQGYNKSKDKLIIIDKVRSLSNTYA